MSAKLAQTLVQNIDIGSRQYVDISHIFEFGWYEWVIPRVEGHSFPRNHWKLGHSLGLSRNADSTLSNGFSQILETVKYCNCSWLGGIVVGWASNAATQCGIMCIQSITKYYVGPSSILGMVLTYGC